MKTKHYLKLKEDVITETLDNGLSIVMVPKSNYHKSFAVLTTAYGALEQKFAIDDAQPIPDSCWHSTFSGAQTI